MRLRRLGARKIALVLLLLVLAYLVVVPGVMLVLSSLRPTGLPLGSGFTVANYVDTYLNPRTYRVMGNTALFAIGSTVVAVAMGLTLSWLVERTDLPGRRLFAPLVILPLVMPPVLLAMAWTLLFSPSIGLVNELADRLLRSEVTVFNIYSLPGMVLVEGLALVPTAYLTLTPVFRNMDPALEQAAEASGAGTLRMLRKVLLPLVAPALYAVGTFVFIVSLVVFDVPGVLGEPAGIRVLSSDIVYRLRPAVGFPEYGEVSALAMALMVILVGLVVAYRRAIRTSEKYVTVSGKGFRPRRFSLGRYRVLAAALAWGYLFAAVFAPFAVLAWSSLLPFPTGLLNAGIDVLSLSNHVALFGNVRFPAAARNTLVVGFASAVGVALLAFWVSWLVVRTRERGRAVVDILAFAPLAMPAAVLAVSLIYVYLTLPVGVFGTVGILIVMYVTVFLSYGSRVTNSALLQIHPDLEEVARASGASWGRTTRRVTLPLVAPAVIAVWVWVFAHAARELTGALILQGGSNVVLPTLLWGYWDSGQANIAAAVGVWLIIGLAVLSLCWYLIQRRAAPTRQVGAP